MASINFDVDIVFAGKRMELAVIEPLRYRLVDHHARSQGT
jgi:hypothetical protein